MDLCFLTGETMRDFPWENLKQKSTWPCQRTASTPEPLVSSGKIQCWGSVTFSYGSGSADPYLWLTDPAIFVSDLQGWQLRKLIFFLSFFVYYFLRLHLQNFSKIKSHKEVPKQEEWSFSLLFLLDDRRSRIRIREAHSYGSGSATQVKLYEVLTAEVLWIRIHSKSLYLQVHPHPGCVVIKISKIYCYPFIIFMGSLKDVVCLGWPIAPGEGGGWVSAKEYSCAQGAQINFRDLTSYLTFDCSPLGDSPRDVGRTFELWSDEEENPASLAIPAALAPAAHLEGTQTNKKNETSIRHWAPTPPPPSPTQGKAGRSHLSEEVTPLLPTGLGERFSQTILNLGHAALLRRCEIPHSPL